MRILYVIKRADSSGAPHHLARLIDCAMASSEVHLCVGAIESAFRDRLPAGVRVHELDALSEDGGLLQIVRSVSGMRALIAWLKPDLVHVHSPLAGFTVRLAALSLGRPCVFTAHGWNFAPGLPWTRRLASLALEWLIARFGQPIIAVSAYDYALARRYRVAKEPQLRTIVNGIEAQLPSVQVIREPATTIVMVARFSDQKRQEDLIAAVAGIDTPLIVKFIGDGERRALCEQLAAEVSRHRIDFLGALPSAEPHLQGADLLVLSSNYEGLPLSILEAMRAGVAVIAADVGGVGEAVVHGETGLLFAPGDVPALRAHLQHLIGNDDARRRLALAGATRFVRQFTEQTMLDTTFALYETMASHSDRTP